jgi:hypothetical protein
MALRPTDMLVIQSAIDDYERKYPRRPAPTAEVALTWRVGKREAARVLGQAGEASVKSEADGQECGPFAWAMEKLRLRLDRTHREDDESFETVEETMPWLRGLLVLGGWSAGAVVAVSLFFFGALVGGYK